MIFSLPSYRRLGEADLARLRRDEDCNSLSRIARVLFNLLVLAGLWGAPFYARWVLLGDMVGTENLAKAALGEWGNDPKAVVEFTAAQQVRLFREGALIETADYRIVGNLLMVNDFHRQPGDRHLPVNPQCFQISIHDNQLILIPASSGFTPIPDNAAWEGSTLRLVLPTWHGSSVTFQRRNHR